MQLLLLLLVMALIMPVSLIAAGMAYVYGPPAWLALGLLLSGVAAVVIRHDQRRARLMGYVPVGEPEGSGVTELARALAVDIAGIAAGVLLLILFAVLIAGVAHFFPHLKPIQNGQ